MYFVVHTYGSSGVVSSGMCGGGVHAGHRVHGNIADNDIFFIDNLVSNLHYDVFHSLLNPLGTRHTLFHKFPAQI